MAKRHDEEAPHAAPDAPTEFLLRFARAGHDAGYSTAELEDRLQALARSLGLKEARQLLTNQTVSGITAGFDTFVTAISIAYGLMISAIVLPRRFTQISA